MRLILLFFSLLAGVLPSLALALEGKILATPVVTQVEGAGGGGIVPFATLAGYASRDEVAVSSFATGLRVDDLDLDVYGLAVNWHDRVEVSIARQKLDVLPLQTSIRQTIYGVKARLYGDIVYSQWPQVSVGLQFKHLADTAIANAVGADDTRSVDAYLAMTRLHLGAVGGFNFLWNLTARYTQAHQTGFLGFNDDYSLQLEGSAALLLNRHLAIGMEYRAKPDELGFAEEQDWQDLFVAWFPNKTINLTLAYADIGDVAGLPDQRGLYLSTTVYLR